jgi:hypothetical protein
MSNARLPTVFSRTSIKPPGCTGSGADVVLLTYEVCISQFTVDYALTKRGWGASMMIAGHR